MVAQFLDKVCMLLITNIAFITFPAADGVKCNYIILLGTIVVPFYQK